MAEKINSNDYTNDSNTNLLGGENSAIDDLLADLIPEETDSENNNNNFGGGRQIMMDSTIIQKLDPVIDEVYKRQELVFRILNQHFLKEELYEDRISGISDYEEYLRTLSSDFDEAKSL